MGAAGDHRVPPDIEKRLEALFPDPVEHQEASSLIASLWSMRIGVGADQLARSILVITRADLATMCEIFRSNFYGDPRDVIVEAERRLGFPGQWGMTPFRD